jgi:putative flippase GtrA
MLVPLLSGIDRAPAFGRLMTMPGRFDWIIEAGRIVRFGIIGIAATLIYVVAAFLAVEFGHLSPIAGAIIGQATSSLVSYFGHAYYSFVVTSGGYRTFLWRFLVISVLSFGINIATTWLLTFAMALSHRIAIMVVAILIAVTNYLCNRYWVFLPGIARSARLAGANPRQWGREIGRQ